MLGLTVAFSNILIIILLFLSSQAPDLPYALPLLTASFLLWCHTCPINRHTFLDGISPLLVVSSLISLPVPPLTPTHIHIRKHWKAESTMGEAMEYLPFWV